jgi:hypothetical protein
VFSFNRSQSLDPQSLYSGSRKHVLDWTSQPEFAVELLQLVQPVDCRLSARSQWMPRGYGAPAEARLDVFGPRALGNAHVWPALRSWWLAHEAGANTPNWDVAVSCDVEGRPGVVLVEAKASAPELSPAGKAFPAGASAESAANHERIGAAIREACTALRRLSASTAISRDSHYQLSNRLAFAWKLAALGIPTVLVYLGFCGDSGMVDAGAPFQSDADWRVRFGEYAASVVPRDIFDRRLDCGAAPAWLLVRSRRVIEPSEPRLSRQLQGTA